MQDFKKEVGSAIAEARQATGMTQVQLATKLNTGQPYVAEVEQGTRNLTLNQLERFAQAIGCTGISITLYRPVKAIAD